MFALNHDLHIHSTLSSCCHDPDMLPTAMATRAKAWGYDTLCLTNHLWDRGVPGTSAWYAPQDIAHCREALPLPQLEGLRFCFGCEVDFLGGDKLSLLNEHFSQFDLVVVSLSHMHMQGLVRPPGIDTPEQMAELFTTRAEELMTLPLPFPKIGIAHLNAHHLFREGSAAAVLRCCDISRWRRIFQQMAVSGAGVELNAIAFAHARDDLNVHLAFFALARDEGCRFYCASDAHRLEAMPLSGLRPVADALGLAESQRYFIP